MMKIEGFEGCCTASIICGFGGGHVEQIENHTKQQVIAWVSKQLTALKKDYNAIVTAMPTSTQPNAIAALEELGFYGHPNPKLCHKFRSKHLILPFFISLAEWDEKAFNKRYDPDKDTYENKPNRNMDQFELDRRANRRYW